MSEITPADVWQSFDTLDPHTNQIASRTCIRANTVRFVLDGCIAAFLLDPVPSLRGGCEAIQIHHTARMIHQDKH